MYHQGCIEKFLKKHGFERLVLPLLLPLPTLVVALGFTAHSNTALAMISRG
jgi:hypothetical protein